VDFDVNSAVRNLIRGTFSKAASMYDIPSPLHAIIQDPITSVRYGCNITLEQGEFLRVELLGKMMDGCTPNYVADALLANNPDISLLCDAQTSRELLGSSSLLEGEDYFSLLSRPGGIIQVYHPKYRDNLTQHDMLTLDM